MNVASDSHPAFCSRRIIATLTLQQTQGKPAQASLSRKISLGMIVDPVLSKRQRSASQGESSGLPSFSCFS
ncbi:hypothetical protein D0N87_22560 [Pseudomonas sp. ATCC 13867]|nr:hypothetical protein D0N87_22560 [Pseudomonas sp. ATCC 13867]